MAYMWLFVLQKVMLMLWMCHQVNPSTLMVATFLYMIIFLTVLPILRTMATV